MALFLPFASLSQTNRVRPLVSEATLLTGDLKEERMAESTEQPKMKPTLGLTGVTVNAMALIAPGAFLWITFVVQAGYAYPSGMAMWAGIFAALLLAYATASLVLGTGQALSGRGQFVSVRGAGVSEHDSRLSVLRESPSSSSVGPRIFTTGFIRA